MTTLYIKTHNITGLKYFGKTVNKDVHKYKGSGVYWINHILKHGYDVTTEIYAQFADGDESITDIAVAFSKDNNIVESKDWANLMEETGGFGGTGRYGELNSNYGKKWPEGRRKELSKKLKGKINVRCTVTGDVFKTSLDEYNTNENLEAESKGRVWSEQTRENMPDRNNINNNNAKVIDIFNSENELVYTSYGNFKDMCIKYRLPYGPFCRAGHTGKKLYMKKKSSEKKYQKFKGWYTKIKGNE